VAAAREDERVAGRSYGYVVVPRGGLRAAGRAFAEGPRAVGRGWCPILVAAGCVPITQADYEAWVAGRELEAWGEPASRRRDAVPQEQQEQGAAPAAGVKKRGKARLVTV